jgi:hypothetical protein
MIDMFDEILQKYSEYFKIAVNIDEKTMSPLLICSCLLNTDIVFKYKLSYSNMENNEELKEKINSDLTIVVRDLKINKIIEKI